jgi:hypothetical protein
MFIKHEQARDFICPLKSNRKVALSLPDKQQGRFYPVDTLPLEANATQEVYLEGVDFPLLFSKQVWRIQGVSATLLREVSCSSLSAT